ncbi:VOC family protein [Dendrosporobacter sp. 1207_IL3150]|uniref:VOC family protein n=1 Tax=Dendrosporobacter sp. 1207_IL3150 TaxID=3084054 RepID=UPI002FDAEF17
MFKCAHVGIVVSNTDLSVDFYCNVLGCKLVDSYQNSFIKLTYLSSGNYTIELIQYADKDNRVGSGAVDHLAFKVKDIGEAINKLKGVNVEFIFTEPKLVNNKKIVFFKGPDSERLELIQEIT